MFRLVICVSGGGTNLQHIIDRIGDGTVRNVRVVRVISNNAGAYALERAKKAEIEAVCVSPKAYETRERFNEALLSAVREPEPDLIVLAGFLVAIPPEMIRAFPNRIINIHPSLIPSFCGRGFYGLRVHEKALERGVRVTGATVHFVDEGMDSGPILLQKAVEVREHDTPELLQRRVMEEAEWILLSRAIALIAEGRVRIENGRALIADEEAGRADGEPAPAPGDGRTAGRRQ
ncbi:phosphoribosylglycinamide formyltransferase [Lachnoclostridium sp. Marseille-P6806]|uniref:phosphoribosylglycinamide formyltransferase n=1 Tax=Lachnoclostridium sp. Marseille-P6806 TaxID=2364793 RepID=UPI001030F9FE|nr:phosphoribosylglycinamide formyltransferase [Lachnoclostridium sp. Marseille-P6806]